MLLKLTDRQKLVVRAALSSLLSNLDDVNEGLDNGNGGITTGSLSGPEIAEGEVNAILAHFDKTPPPASDDGEPLTLRAFRGNFLVAIDENERDEYDIFDEVDDDDEGGENGTNGEPDLDPVTLDEVKEYLKDAAAVDMDMEEYGNPVGFQSLELQFESIEELPPEEVRRLYKK